jgi:hypothetical protein
MNEEQQHETPVYVVATRADPTRHALTVAQALAKTRGTSVVIVVPPPEQMPRCAVEAVPTTRALVAADAPDAHVLFGPYGGLDRVSQLLPIGATIVLSGPIRHFLETDEQHLARKLATRGHEVVFLPLTTIRSWDL